MSTAAFDSLSDSIDACTVSVCMATYNGQRFVHDQLKSILDQLRADDEVVVVDDGSSDATVAVIEAMRDPRIRLFRNAQNQGYVRTFELAMKEARGDVLFLADQDDLWAPGRRDVLVRATAHGAVVASNLTVLGRGEPLRSPMTGRPWLLHTEDSTHRARNQLRILAGDAPYYGCTMAIRRDALALVLPLPDYLKESHDLWIATVANWARMLRHEEATTTLRRLHEQNASTSRPRGVRKALTSRLLMLRLWAEARRRIRRSGD